MMNLVLQARGAGLTAVLTGNHVRKLVYGIGTSERNVNEPAFQPLNIYQQLYGNDPTDTIPQYHGNIIDFMREWHTKIDTKGDKHSYDEFKKLFIAKTAFPLMGNTNYNRRVRVIAILAIYYAALGPLLANPLFIIELAVNTAVLIGSVLPKATNVERWIRVSNSIEQQFILQGQEIEKRAIEIARSWIWATPTTVVSAQSVQLFNEYAQITAIQFTILDAVYHPVVFALRLDNKTFIKMYKVIWSSIFEEDIHETVSEEVLEENSTNIGFLAKCMNEKSRNIQGTAIFQSTVGFVVKLLPILQANSEKAERAECARLVVAEMMANFYGYARPAAYFKSDVDKIMATEQFEKNGVWKNKKMVDWLTMIRNYLELRDKESFSTIARQEFNNIVIKINPDDPRFLGFLYALIVPSFLLEKGERGAEIRLRFCFVELFQIQPESPFLNFSSDISIQRQFLNKVQDQNLKTSRLPGHAIAFLEVHIVSYLMIHENHLIGNTAVSDIDTRKTTALEIARKVMYAAIDDSKRRENEVETEVNAAYPKVKEFKVSAEQLHEKFPRLMFAYAEKCLLKIKTINRREPPAPRP